MSFFIRFVFIPFFFIFIKKEDNLLDDDALLLFIFLIFFVFFFVFFVFFFVTCYQKQNLVEIHIKSGVGVCAFLNFSILTCLIPPPLCPLFQKFQKNKTKTLFSKIKCFWHTKKTESSPKKRKQQQKKTKMERGGPPTGGSSVAFSASLAALPLKYLFKTLGCCAKISPEVLIEAHPSSGLRIKAVNQNHSAFLSCILRTNAFDGYECCAVEKAADKNDDDDFVATGAQTALLAKHVLGCLRSNRVDRVR